MRVAIYGAGEVGQECCLNLLRVGIRPEAFFDRKAKSGKKCLDIPLLQIDEYPDLARCDTIVIIALADGLLHKEVADKLYTRGFRKLVFLPIAYDMPTRLKTKLTILYNEYLEGRVTGVVQNYGRYAKESFFEAGQAVASAGIDKVVVWVPLEIVYTESLEHWPGDKNNLHSPYAYYDRNIATNYWMLNLIRYFQGMDGSCDLYLSMYERNGGAKPNIEKRRLQFELFEHEYSFGMEFFIHSAPEAMWNERGYFNIVGGNHRIMYLYAKGCRYFPLKISRKDFCKWQGMEAVTPDLIEGITYPISHPAFQHVIVHGLGEIYHTFKSIEESYGHADLSNKKILDLSHTEGFFARQFARMKASKVTVAVKAEKLAFYEKLNRLMCVSDIEFVDESVIESAELNYDIILRKDSIGMVEITEQTGKNYE